MSANGPENAMLDELNKWEDEISKCTDLSSQEKEQFTYFKNYFKEKANKYSKPQALEVAKCCYDFLILKQKLLRGQWHQMDLYLQKELGNEDRTAELRRICKQTCKGLPPQIKSIMLYEPDFSQWHHNEITKHRSNYLSKKEKLNRTYQDAVGHIKELLYEQNMNGIANSLDKFLK
uniref:Uncharacterized protein n=2 Tax=Acrobeloides nanus TaxID=290746 RepID=A0A914D2R5_9BILA